MDERLGFLEGNQEMIHGSLEAVKEIYELLEERVESLDGGEESVWMYLRENLQHMTRLHERLKILEAKSGTMPLSETLDHHNELLTNLKLQARLRKG